MQRHECDVVVIGGGATGVGVLRDAAMRGHRAILIERADLAQGTTGRHHGLLHSGGRYVCSDPGSARECARENAILTRIHADAVEATGGLFVATPDDDPAYGDRFAVAAAATRVLATELSPAAALRREPRLNPAISRAFEVADGSIDGWAMVCGAVNSAREYGGRVLTYHQVTGFEVADGRIRAVHCLDRRGDPVIVDTRFVINAAGAWAGQIAELAGCGDVEVVPGRGIMIAMAHRLVNTVINRLAPPDDGDILVPVHTVSIIGTTDVYATDPDHLPIPADEVQQLLDDGERLIPGFRQARALRAWAGARPLIRDTRVVADDTRHMSRGMALMDHRGRDGMRGLLTIAGGKLTTYRLMAERAVDAMESQLGERRPCRTATEPVPGAIPGRTYAVTRRLADRESDRLSDQIVCECELLARRQVEAALAADPQASLDDLRRRLRLGMGPCQGGFCGYRAAGIAGRGADDLIDFIEHRWIGLWPILYGDQLRQAALDEWLWQGLLGIELLPGESAGWKPAVGNG